MAFGIFEGAKRKETGKSQAPAEQPNLPHTPSAKESRLAARYAVALAINLVGDANPELKKLLTSGMVKGVRVGDVAQAAEGLGVKHDGKPLLVTNIVTEERKLDEVAVFIDQAKCKDLAQTVHLVALGLVEAGRRAGGRKEEDPEKDNRQLGAEVRASLERIVKKAEEALGSGKIPKRDRKDAEEFQAKLEQRMKAPLVLTEPGQQ